MVRGICYVCGAVRRKPGSTQDNADKPWHKITVDGVTVNAHISCAERFNAEAQRMRVLWGTEMDEEDADEEDESDGDSVRELDFN